MADSDRNDLPKSRLIRLRNIQHLVGLGRSTMY
jgi:predicted DNA-binding transcriptional regulator AlpA